MGRYDGLLSVLGAVACATVLAIAVRLEPDPRGVGTHEGLGLAPCGFLQRTGKPCLSCGMTTAFANMARGRVGAALDANPYGVLLFLATCAGPFWCLASLRRRQSPLRFLSHPAARIVAPVAALLLLLNWGWMILRAAPPDR
ncbi:MAG TPA: DUF2752 domain-containing protein [Planctomycetota bacterium]|nr:DUF2752 domain-containing protein [Planctomycetota bacterium]